MTDHTQNLIVGQGLAGSCVAWTLHLAGQKVLLLDREPDVTASKVAAGLITPFTGQRFTKAPDFDEYWATAVTFYRTIEAMTGQSFLDCADMILLTADTGDLPLPEWTGALQTGGEPACGVTMTPAGRLNVVKFLQVTRRYFESHQSYRRMNLNPENDINFESHRIVIPKHSLTADRVIVCQGAKRSRLFPTIPNNPSRGDILRVRIPNFATDRVIHRGLWIAPNADTTQSVGATYDWKHINNQPRDEGRRELLTKLSRTVTGPVEVVAHQAAVRPTMKDFQPVVGRHPHIQNLFVLNGLGSKGTLRAPRLAAILRDLLMRNKQVPVRLRPERLLAKSTENEGRRKPLTTVAQDFVAAVLAPGDTAVDATVGNGFDTCFLAERVGPTGRVIGFDVQHDAIQSTARRLSALGLRHVQLRHKSHEQITDLPSNSIRAVMFNLGFLPRSDHITITQPDSSTAAISASLERLCTHGLITVLCYRGHDGGPEEFAAVECLLEQIQDRYDVTRIDSNPPKSTSPVLFVIRK